MSIATIKEIDSNMSGLAVKYRHIARATDSKLSVAGFSTTLLRFTSCGSSIDKARTGDPETRDHLSAPEGRAAWAWDYCQTAACPVEARKVTFPGSANGGSSATPSSRLPFPTGCGA